MRLARFVLSYILLSIFGLLMAIFLAQNIRLEHLAFFGLDFTFNFVWMLLGAAVFGFLLTLFLFFPSRIALTLHSHRLEREAEQLAQHVAWLQEQREDLLTRHEDLLTYHQHLLRQHRRLLADYGSAVAERDQVRTQLASLETISIQKRAVIPAVITSTVVSQPREKVGKAQTPPASPVSPTAQPAAESEPISASQDTAPEQTTPQTAPTPPIPSTTPPLRTTEPRIAVVTGLVRRINEISERVGQRMGR